MAKFNPGKCFLGYNCHHKSHSKKFYWTRVGLDIDQFRLPQRNKSQLYLNYIGNMVHKIPFNGTSIHADKTNKYNQILHDAFQKVTTWNFGNLVTFLLFL